MTPEQRDEVNREFLTKTINRDGKRWPHVVVT